MLSHLMPQCAVSGHKPLVALHPHVADYELNVALAWCTSVALGRMPRGPLLAHAHMEGDELVMHQSGQHFVPRSATTFGPSTPGRPTDTMVLH